MIRQISVFAERKTGALQDITSILAAAGINIYSLVTTENEEFGIVRMTTSDSPRALSLFQEAGYLCHKAWVLAVVLDDAPGALDALLVVLRDADIQLDYAYVACTGAANDLFAILKVRDEEAGETAVLLGSMGFPLLSE